MSDGSIITSTHDISVVRNGVGTTTVTLPPGFRMVSVTVSPVTGSNVTALIISTTDRAFTVGAITVTTTPVAVDVWINFVAVGVQM